MRSIRLLIWLCLIIMFTGCTSSETTKNDPKLPDNKMWRGGNEKMDPADEPVAFLSTDEAKDALRAILNQGYRIAQPSDYHFSDKALQIINEKGFDKQLKNPFIVGDFNRDNLYPDAVVVLINTKKSDQNNWAVVALNQPATLSSELKPVWCYQDKDLSKSVLNQRGGGMVLDELRDDGTIETCKAEWDKTSQNYLCDKKAGSEKQEAKN